MSLHNGRRVRDVSRSQVRDRELLEQRWVLRDNSGFYSRREGDLGGKKQLRTLGNKNSQALDSRKVFFEKGKNGVETSVSTSHDSLKSGEAKSENSQLMGVDKAKTEKILHMYIFLKN